MVANRPDWIIQVAFNADPNDPSAVPIWTDITANVMGASAIARGKQYELAQSQAAQPTVTIRDVNEYYNPANGSSPYSPNILPYRQILWQGAWTPSTLTNTVTGNLLNTAGWRVNYDPTFESYTTGAAPVPNWTVGVGSTVPIVANART